MLNPSTDKYTIEFSADFFSKDITKKYDDYLFHLNGPIKNMRDHLQESIQSLDIPGIELNLLNVNGLNNMKNVDFTNINSSPTNFNSTTINRQFPGTSPNQEIITETKVSITFRNTLLNWMYIYETFHHYYKRKRDISDFSIIITLHDAADIPLMNFVFFDCFVSSIPGLNFAFNTQFREAKTIDAGFAFNGMSTNFMIPSFDLTKSNIKSSIKDRIVTDDR
jgi:hypothetical protein